MSQNSNFGQPTKQPFQPPTTNHGGSKTSGKAIASLVLGFLSIVGMCFTGIPGLILGILGLGDANRSNGRVGGKGMAIFGIVLSSLGIVWTIIVLLIAIMLPAVQAARSAARQQRSMNNMRQLQLGMLNYESAHMEFSPRDKNGLSWRVHILPFIDEQALYQRFHLDEPWDSPHNIQLLSEMPLAYECPNLVVPFGQTIYQVPYTDVTKHPEPDDLAMFDTSGRPATIGRVTDGSSNTIGILEVDEAAAVEWTKPADWEFDPANPKRDLGNVNPRFISVSFVDGSTHRIPANISPEEFKAIITRSAGDATPNQFDY